MKDGSSLSKTYQCWLNDSVATRDMLGHVYLPSCDAVAFELVVFDVEFPDVVEVPDELAFPDELDTAGVCG